MGKDLAFYFRQMTAEFYDKKIDDILKMNMDDYKSSLIMSYFMGAMAHAICAEEITKHSDLKITCLQDLDEIKFFIFEKMGLDKNGEKITVENKNVH